MAITPGDKRAQLAALLKQQALQTKQAPLSFMQERMWFLEQWNPGSASFNMPVAVRLSGQLDVEALHRSLREIVRRHDTLRSTFGSDAEGRPLQTIAPTLDVALPLVDLQALPDREREAEAWRRLTAEAEKPFDLTRGPLFHFVLFRLTQTEHLLLINLHHIAGDAWSLGVFTRELGLLYQAAAEGRPGALPALPLQYGEFASWQRGWLRGEVLETQLAYWRSKLDPSSVLELPTDRPRPAQLSPRGARNTAFLPLPLTEALKELSLREGTTLFVTLLAGFEVLLSRYSGQTDLTVGTLVAGRQRAELEGMIGLFINTLPIRTSLDGASTFRELMGRLHETALQAFTHQDLPFEKLVDALKPGRNLGRLPIFQVVLILQNAPQPPLKITGLEMEAIPVDTGTTKHDLTLLAVDMPQGLRIALEYSTDLFDDATITRMQAHLRALLEAAVKNPAQRIADLPLLDDTERRQLLVEWNGAKSDYPQDACIHDLFEAQARKTPDAVALVFEGASLTYRELDARANQLAHHLRAMGVGPESRVGLCVERSLELVVGLLGVLKAGGAYVPLEPGYPRERLAWMLEDARPAVLLAQERLLPRLPAHEARVLCLDSGWAEVAKQPSTRLEPRAAAGNLAYAIFTSGSTGRPKGAMNEHRAVRNRLLWMQDAYGLGGQDVVLQKTPFSFDVSVWEFFWPLMTGARLVVARPGGHQDPAYLAQVIVDHGVTTLHFVPSMLQVFLEEPAAQRCASLRRVVCSGEALPLELKERFLQRLPWAGLHNLYGPTEAAVDVTFHACQARDGRRSVPIGKPVANTQIRILDSRLQPSPIGVPGELYIGGVQVGRGYLSRPDLTADRFIPDPFAGTPGARMYRTGDVARWWPDGNIEYVGRADFQVKVRGLRIELGEIETALEQQPSVAQAVVLAREDGAGDKRLVAYVVGRAGAPAVDPAELRRGLQQRLPEYMVPSAFVVLDAMPLSPNGKVDRKALPAPELGRQGASRPFVAPRTDLERTIVQVWQQLLGLERIGVDDNFFELGGHSLLATQLRNQLFAALKVDLPLQVLFNSPTVAGVAALVEKELAEKSAAEEEPIAERLNAAFPTERQEIFEAYLRRLVAKGVRRKVEELPADGSLKDFDLRLLGAELQYDLRQDLKFELFPHEVREHPSIPELAQYLVGEMERLADLSLLANDIPLSAYTLRPYRKRDVGSAPAPKPARKNPGIVFLLSSPRAGSTLSRVMLAGHPQLFSPPEMKLLYFNSMKEWRYNVGLGQGLEWTEGGLLWAFMELMGLDSAGGQAYLDKLVAEDVPTQEVYARLQALAGQRLLVDKTPGYSLDPETLQRAEECFDKPKYLYLYRHPYPVMESMLRVRLDRIVGPILFGDADVDPHLVAEVVWAMCNRNLIEFADRVGRERCHWLRYEDLVRDPAGVMKGVCEFLKIPFDERVVQPYDGKRERMLGGVGDPNIILHRRIEPELAESWRKIQWPRPLDPSTRALMARLGYGTGDARRAGGEAA